MPTARVADRAREIQLPSHTVMASAVVRAELAPCQPPLRSSARCLVASVCPLTQPSPRHLSSSKARREDRGRSEAAQGTLAACVAVGGAADRVEQQFGPPTASSSNSGHLPRQRPRPDCRADPSRMELRMAQALADAATIGILQTAHRPPQRRGARRVHPGAPAFSAGCLAGR